jgi:sugar phosphate isomerase/epimerase
MPIDPRRIALSLWTVRRHLQSSAEIARSFERVREIGYEQVELVGLPPLPARELRELADAAGLRICASHEDPLEIVEEPRRVADRLEALGCRLVVYPRPHLPLTTLEQVAELSDALSRAGELLRSRGRLLAYHNHALEFRKLGGKAILDLIYERTDPFMVHAELDTYCVQLGGGDPAGYCARLSGRLPLLQLTDYAVGDDDQPTTAALGEGNLNLPVILREAEAAACELYVVEQDPAPDDDAFSLIAKSFGYLTSL